MMNTFKIFADKYLLNRLTFKILMLLSVMITVVPYLHNIVGGYVKYVLAYGFVVLGYEVLTKKMFLALRIKTNWLLVGFAASFGITVLINHSTGFGEGLKTLAYLIVFFALFYMTGADQTKQSIYKEMKILSSVIIGTTFILSVISLYTYTFSISGRYLNNDGIYIHYGLYENRLWGLYNPNTGAMLNCISVLLSVAFLISVNTKWIRVVNLVNIFIQFSSLILTRSRAAYYILVIFLAIIAVFVTLKKFSKINFKAIASALLAIVLVVAGYSGVGELLKEGYAYVPSITSVVMYELSSHGGASSHTEGKPIIEKQDFTRLEELENREGGFFNGRVDMWVACFETFKKAPVFGVGSENLISRTLEHFNDDVWKEHFRTGGAHNIYVCVLASTGIIGFLLLAAFVIIKLLKAIQVLFKKKLSLDIWFVLALLMCLMFYITEFVEARILFQISTFSVIFGIFCGYLHSLSVKELCENMSTEKVQK